MRWWRDDKATISDVPEGNNPERAKRQQSRACPKATLETLASVLGDDDDIDDDEDDEYLRRPHPHEVLAIYG